ncbi:MAG: DNA polymerase III subunit alpha [Treponema sp.]|nr:DNA polymerase III subunit alpha [Treponema sp.]
MQTRLGLVSGYSFLYGVHKPGALLDRAATFGVKVAGFCDLNGLYGVHSILEETRERGIRPVIGAALTIGSDRKVLYCFIENRAGYSRLCEVLSERNRERVKDKSGFNPLPLIRENAEGLVLASPDEAVLAELNGRVRRLYAAITPSDIRAVSAGRKLNIPLTFLDDSLFLEADDFPVHRVLRAISLLKTIGNLAPGEIAEPDRILRLSKDLHHLSSWPAAVKGTEEIAALCTYNDLFKGWVFPSYPAPSVDDELRRRVYDGNVIRYGELADREVGRIEYELGVIKQMGFSEYFLLIDDIVRMSPRTCGRGSGAASIVSYGLGITNVDPLRHDLYFERFLNPSRPDPPDIDIDFAWDERDDLIKAVIEKFGPGHCGRVANHNMFRYRSALRETAKAYGFGDAEITGLERKLSLKSKDLEIISIDPVWQEIFEIAKKIEGLPRGLGMHCGGIVVTPGPINRYVPVEKSLEGFPLIAWEKEGSEAAGFVKIDLLGNRSLAVIRDAIKNVNDDELEGRLSRALDDKPTIEALARGDSMGVFYIESPAMRQLQRKTGKGDFHHIVIHSSIIRPAANKFINEYVRRLKGGKWEPLHPRLAEILQESYGILCYQEDVSKTAVALAGFNEADADKLRKVIAKKAGGARLAVYKQQYFEGCRKNGVSEETVQKIWEMMLSFDGYSFCKPHSASYAMVSFQSAYLRVHHPAEFMAAVLSNQGGYYRPHAYIAEARRMGLFTVGPDVNVSDWHYYGRGRDIVIGLMSIKGLSSSGAKQIFAERERGGEYKSLEDFSERVRLGRDDIIALCPAGVFDSISNINNASTPRPLQARRLLGMRREAGTGGGAGGSSTGSIRGGTPGLFENIQTPVPVLPAPDLSNKLKEEYRALGFLRNVHPLALWKDDVLAIKNRVKALHIENHIGRSVKMIGWPVTQKDVWTKDGLTMSFLSLEDETAMYETVIFPDVYERFNKLLFDQQPLLVYGRVMIDNGAVSLEINRIQVLGKQGIGARSSLYPTGQSLMCNL